jgi:hypothetical protein
MLKSPEANAAVAEAEAANARAEARDLPCADRIDLAQAHRKRSSVPALSAG